MKTKLELKKMLTKAPLDALMYLENAIDEEQEKELFDLIILLKSRLEETEKSNIAGALSNDEYYRTLSSIRVNIMSIIEKTPDDYFSIYETSKKETYSNYEITIILEVSTLIRKLVLCSIN